MRVMGVFLKKEECASQSPALIWLSVIVQSDVVVGGGAQRRLLFTAIHSIEKSKSLPALPNLSILNEVKHLVVS